MKHSRSTLAVLVLCGVLFFWQYQSSDKSRERDSTEEQSIGTTQSLNVLPIAPTVSSGVSTEYLVDATQNESRFMETGNGIVTLTIPDDMPANSEWITIDQLKSTIGELDEELSFTIEEQGEEFRIVDISDYSIFLHTLELDSPTQQNILAQLVDSNRAGFTRILHHAVELQANGYVAWITNPARDNGYFDFIVESSPAAVMSRNLNPDQLESFYDFEAGRLSQKTNSPDYIPEFLERLGL